MSQRIEKMMKGARPDEYPLCVEMAKLVTESFKQTEGEPQVMRVAKAQAHVLERLPIFIEDGELIVGNAASKPMGAEALVPVSFTKEGIGALKQDVWKISAEDELQIESLNRYWKNANFISAAIQMQDDDRLWPFTQSGWMLPPFKKKEDAGNIGFAKSGLSFLNFVRAMGWDMDFLSVDYGKVINRGLNSYVEEAEQELRKPDFTSPDSVNKVYFLKAAVITHKAVIHFAHRFSDLAAKMASKETDPTRKNELMRIGATCKVVPANPATTFCEAIQSFWFLYLMFVGDVTPMQRFDQFMFPFYQKDKKEGKITDDEVLELLQCLRIKDMQIAWTSASPHRDKWSGLAKWNNMVIGGQTPDGKDATNELSYLILEALKRCPTPHHTVTLRVHEGTPEALMLSAIECVRAGLSMPAFVGDKAYIENLLSKGVPLRVARDYFLNGCLEANVPEGCGAVFPICATALAFDFALHDGVDHNTGHQIGPKTGDLTSFKSFDELLMAYKKQLSHCLALETESRSIYHQVAKDAFPDAFTASLFTDGIKKGKPRLDCELPYGLGPTINTVGMINVANSLAAIKKVVFDDQKVTMKQLKAALEANWQGDGYAEMRKIFSRTPKYGNDDDYVDLIARDLYQFFADTAFTLDSPRGKKYNTAAISISGHQPTGALMGATPDGRYAREILADGSMSPVQGTDTRGPTAVFKSASKIDQANFQSTLLNMKFHPSALKTREDMRKLSDLIKTYFSMGGKHVQFNVVGKETLLDAQKHPEKYRNLVVRVAGYSAYFTQLTKQVQDEIVARAEHQLGA